eukprot:6172673-Alexandrium_andersonii.AAC.1
MRRPPRTPTVCSSCQRWSPTWTQTYFCESWDRSSHFLLARSSRIRDSMSRAFRPTRLKTALKCSGPMMPRVAKAPAMVLKTVTSLKTDLVCSVSKAT